VSNAFREALVRRYGPEGAEFMVQSMHAHRPPRPQCFVPEELEDRLSSREMTERQISRLVKELAWEALERLVPKMVQEAIDRQVAERIAAELPTAIATGVEIELAARADIS
jgi:hypothetical protein